MGFHDLRYAGRMLVRKPVFALVCILTLAVGIGANTAIFSVINSVVLEPLPYPESRRLAVVWSALGREGRAPSSGPELISLRERSRGFDQFGGIWVQSGALTGEGEPEQVKLGWVTSNFLPLLSDHPQFGRFFSPAEEGEGKPQVAILSDELWRRRYGADPKIIGQAVRLSGRLCTVVGVMPAHFKLIFPEGASVPPRIDVYVPFQWELSKQPRDQAYIRIIGRLRAGATIEEAQAELDNIATELRSEFVEYAGQGLRLQTISLQGDVSRNVRPALFALFGGTGFILLIVCANLAMLALSRGNERRNEMGLRAALGAKPRRIVRQLLTENLLLSFLGGTAALALSSAILRLLWSLEPAGIARATPTGVDGMIFAFNAMVSAICGILFGLFPALEAKRFNLAGVLSEGSRATTVGKQTLPQMLIGCEVALTFVLLASSTLLLHSFLNLLEIDPGFSADRVVTFQVSLPDLRYPSPERAIEFIRAAQRNLSTMPGVESVGVVSHLPFDDNLPNWYSYFWREGAPEQEQNTLMADHRSVLPGFFDSLHVRFIEGRNFETSDEQGRRKVAVVDDLLAKQLWPHESALGKPLNIENGDFVRDVVEVIGTIKHVQYHSLTDSVRPQVYLPYTMAVRSNMSFTIRTRSAPETMAPLIHKEMAKLDKDLPVANVRPLNAYVSGARSEARFITVLCAAMAGIALLLAWVGIYGVTVSSVRRRTKEIGVRLALGAQPREIFAMMLRRSIRPVALGSLAGLALTMIVLPLFSALFVAFKKIEPGYLTVVFATLIVVAMLAASIPTQRLLRENPIDSLRHE